MTPDRVLLSTGEVARQYGVSNSTVRRWADSGLLPAFRTPGGNRRFRAEDVEALIASTSNTPAQPGAA